MKDEFVDPEVGKKEPQCIAVCPKEAISLKNVEQIGEETRIEAVRRLFGNVEEFGTK
jgi:Fe-S-cluster-containing dehydrogenase component